VPTSADKRSDDGGALLAGSSHVIGVIRTMSVDVQLTSALVGVVNECRLNGGPVRPSRRVAAYKNVPAST
jgi:hypothetical protein